MSKLPHSVQDRVEMELDVSLGQITPVSGGCISQSVRVDTQHSPFFVKWDTSDRRAMFEAEVHGLMLLAETEEIRVPEIYGWGECDGTVYLVTEFVETGSMTSDNYWDLGCRLANLHTHTSDQFGLDWDTYIGTLPQSNTRHETWADFFVHERLKPQIERAREAGFLSEQDIGRFDTLFGKMADWFPKEKPALLHGDLWAGNVLFDESGEPVVIDPAVYYGNREMELAFTHLFGGFSQEFYEAYQESFPLAGGFEERKSVYNLYPLLVHLNLFGEMYIQPIRETLRRYV